MSTAAINVVTGINGSGKTLYLLPMVEKLRKETGRPVYYWAVPGLTEKKVLDEWIEIAPYDADDPKLENPGQVHQLPNEAIIVIDEAHIPFGRSGAKECPPHIEPFARCRHKGHTFFLCTQNAADLHTFIRARIGKHWHLRRSFGMERAIVYQWEKYGDPESTKSVKECIKANFTYPKEVYEWYQSSQAHTIEKAIPWKIIIWIPIILAITIAAAVFVWHRISNMADVDQTEQPTTTPAPAGTQAPPQQTAAAVPGDEWLSVHKPRVDGMPMSAPMYDDLYKAKAIPRISGCSHIQTEQRNRCTCHTQQGSRIAGINYQQCRAYIRDGWFDPTKPDEAPQQAPTALATANPQPSLFPEPPAP